MLKTGQAGAMTPILIELGEKKRRLDLLIDTHFQIDEVAAMPFAAHIESNPQADLGKTTSTSAIIPKAAAVPILSYHSIQDIIQKSKDQQQKVEEERLRIEAEVKAAKEERALKKQQLKAKRRSGHKQDGAKPSNIAHDSSKVRNDISKETALQKQVSEIVVKCLSLFKEQITKETFKKHAKEVCLQGKSRIHPDSPQLTKIICEKERRNPKFSQAAEVKPFSKEKISKIRTHVKGVVFALAQNFLLIYFTDYAQKLIDRAALKKAGRNVSAASHANGASGSPLATEVSAPAFDTFSSPSSDEGNSEGEREEPVLETSVAGEMPTQSAHVDTENDIESFLLQCEANAKPELTGPESEAMASSSATALAIGVKESDDIPPPSLASIDFAALQGLARAVTQNNEF